MMKQVRGPYVKQLVVCLLPLLLVGCMSKEMKSTPFYDGDDIEYVGDASDRVNLWPIAYWHNPVGSVMWPIVSFSDDYFAFFPLYSQNKKGGKNGEWDEFRALCTFYFSSDKISMAPFYLQRKQDGKNGEWDEFWALCCLMRADTKHDDYHIFPVFWGKERKGRSYQVVFPIYFNKNDRNLLLPLWYYCNTEDSWKFYMLAWLSGWEMKDDGLKWLYVFPLFGWYNDGSWMSPLGGQVNCDDTTRTFFTPLVGVKSGKKTGSWVFPVWLHDKDSDFDEKVALIDSPTLPDCVNVRVRSNDVNTGEDFVKTYFAGDDFSRTDDTFVLLYKIGHSISGSAKNCKSDPSTSTYEIAERYKCGHRILLGYASERSVTFDLKTRSKLSDAEKSEANFIFWLYQYEWNHDRMKGEEYARHRVLWRLWDWEGENGDVSLDVFPGFTYDHKKDGRTKTSFLWRFFRYENDPEEGTSIDFLFIPIWR